MIETEKKTERVFLVGVELADTENFDLSMEELQNLAKTAGAEVVGSYSQKREKYDSKTFVGSGKLEEIRQMVDAEEISTVIVNNRLTPRQNVNLEESLGVKVIDRMQLILDIFAMRARSHEGKLQVHLAQLKYLLPRLVGQGIMLSRQAGGIGPVGLVKASWSSIDAVSAIRFMILSANSRQWRKIEQPFVKNGWNPVFSKSDSSAIPMLESQLL